MLSTPTVRGATYKSLLITLVYTENSSSRVHVCADSAAYKQYVEAARKRDIVYIIRQARVRYVYVRV